MLAALSSRHRAVVCFGAPRLRALTKLCTTHSRHSMPIPSLEQRAICDAPPDRDVLVISGAGAGKTTAIIQRISELETRHGIAQTKMIYMTYSKKLADEVQSKMAEEGIHDLHHCGTIDSLCYRLLNADPSYSRSMEAGQIIARTLEELDKSPRLLRALDEVSHVFLDEAQDLNLERYKVIDSLMANKAMMVVGDPRQCIYQGLFHADPTLMTRFRSDWVHRTLSTSYRLTKQMAEFVNAGFQYPSLPPMTSGNTYDGPKPTLVVIHGGMEEPDAFKMCRDSLLNSLIAMILHFIDGGAAPGTIAVLSPTKKSGSAAAHLMNRLRTHLERLHVPTYLNSREYDSPDTGGHARRETLYLGTCHSFKGSERDHVLLINFYVAPGAYTRLDSSKEENPDLMNLLYVACTRARRSLHIVESCHYPKQCERVPHLNPESLHHVRVQTIHSAPLGHALNGASHPQTRVTEILGHLDGNDLDILEQRVVSSDSVRCYGKKTRLRTPKIFVQNCDADLYGNFIEAVLARAFSEGTANTDDVCQQIMAMPLYLTDREFRDLLQGVRDAVHPDKFRHTKIDPQWLSSFVVALVAAKNPPEAIKRSLRDKSVIVFTRSSLFYEKLATLFTVIDRIGKTATPTEDVVDAIWEATLLKTFHNNYLGVYWLSGWQQSPSALLPTGAVSWSQYLDQARSLLKSHHLTIAAYQFPLSHGTLNGIADLVTSGGKIIDIKCTLNESGVVGLSNLAQVQCYRGMISTDSAVEQPAFLLSALTLCLYRIPAGNDDAVLDAVDAMRKTQSG